MRFKMWPRPPAAVRSGDADLERRRTEAVETVVAARDALPLVPGSEDDCCARLMDRRGYPSRDVARTWITFLRALGLAEETPDGYCRVREPVEREDLAAALRERVFAVEPLLSVLAAADEPLDAAAAFEGLRDRIPEWERHKHPREWADRWERKVDWLLSWCALFGLLTERDSGYVLADGVAPEG
ncbi:MAG: hypothetical protein ABEJ79_00570 [Halolamina sp.]